VNLFATVELCVVMTLLACNILLCADNVISAKTSDGLTCSGSYYSAWIRFCSNGFVLLFFAFNSMQEYKIGP